MEIEHEIREFVVDNFLFGQSAESFSNSDSFLEKGLIDSVGILTLMEFVRDKYAIEMDEGELIPENWDSVGKIARFVRGKLSSRKFSSDHMHARMSEGYS